MKEKGKTRDFKYSDFGPIMDIALKFPGAEESVSYESTPSIEAESKLMCRLHENGKFVPIKLPMDARDNYLESLPETFHLPHH